MEGETLTFPNRIEPAETRLKQAESLWFKGTLAKIRLGLAQGRTDLAIIEQWLPYGESPPLHIHRNEDEIFLMIEGTMRFVVGGKEIVARAGDTLLAPKEVPHTFRVESPEGAHCFTITTGSDFEKLVRAFGSPALSDELPPPMEPTPEMIEALTRTCRENGIDIVGPPLAGT